MVINFKIHEINRVTYKLTRVSMLIKKKYSTVEIFGSNVNYK
jgi:hypothetical protein